MTRRPFVDDDVPGALALMRSSLGDGRVPRTEAFFRWKHLESPFGRSIGFVEVDEADGDNAPLVALRMFQRWGLQRGAQPIEAVRAVDTATAPQAQGKGHFKRLTLAAVDDATAAGVDLVFNTPNEKSGPGYLKMGWVEVGKPGVWLRAGWPGASTLEDMVPDPVLLAARHPQTPTDDERLRTRQCEAYWRWRYVDIPGSAYRMVLQGTATAIIRRQTRRGIPEVTIVELLHPLTWRGSRDARGLVVTIARSGGGLMVSSMASLPSTTAAVLASAGFVWTPLGPTLFARSLCKDRVSQTPGSLGWAMAIGDLELF
jgi:hypothetical protein